MRVELISKTLVIVFNLMPCLSFNLDIGNAKIFKGQTGSRSGYSVATWKINNSGQYGVVFGAPHWRPNQDAHLRVANAGSVYYCSWQNTTCNIMMKAIDFSITYKETLTALDLLHDAKSLSIGMGETIYSSNSSSSLLVCAPRLIYGKTYLSMNGELHITARGGCLYLQDKRTQSRKILPLDEDTFELRSSEYSMTSGLAGTSALLTESGNRKTVYIGAPLSYFGRGSTITKHWKGHPFHDYRKYNHLSTPYGGNVGDYQGLAMTTGKFNGRQQLVAVALPGCDTKSKVVFYYKNKEHKSRKTVYITDDELSSKFGFSMTSGDFNADGRDDLVVSAPFSSVRMDSMFARKNIEEDAGKVYIYYDPLEQDSGAKNKLVLEGYKRRGLFGYSVFCPGDLNRDGISDLVVGAPRDEKGVIFVYNGSPDGLKRTSTQIIEAADVGLEGLHAGFGFSIAGGHDVDLNEFPDVIVGAIKADSTVLLRAAPVLNLIGVIYFNKTGKIFLGKEKRKIIRDGRQYEVNCFNLTIQLKYSSYGLKSKIPVILTVTLDQFQDSSRILFLSSHSNRRQFQLKATNVDVIAFAPFQLPVYVEPGLTNEKLRDLIYTNATAQLPSKYILRDSLDRQHRDSSNMLPVLNAPSVQFSSNERMICEDEDECYSKSDLRLSIVGNKSFVIGDEKVSITLSLVSKMAASYKIMLKMQQPEGFHISKEVSHSFACTTIKGQGYANVSCAIEDKLDVDREIDVPITFQQTPSTIINAIHKSEQGANFIFYFTVTSDNTDRNYIDNKGSISMKASAKSELYLSSYAIPETTVVWANYSKHTEKKFMEIYNTDSSDVNKFLPSEKFGTTISHRFTILNEGPSPVRWYKATLRVPVAYEMKERLPLSIISSLEVSGRNFSCDLIGQKFSIRKYVLFDKEELQLNETVSRKERSLSYGETDEPQMETFEELECQNNKKVHCITIKCKSYLLMPGRGNEDQLEFKVVFPSFAVNKLERRNFTFSSSFDVTTSSGKKDIIYTKTLVDIQSPMTLKKYLYDNWWLLLATILCGISVILLITLVLYKVGYFKRTKRDQLIIQKKEYRKSMMLMKNAETLNTECTPTRDI